MSDSTPINTKLPRTVVYMVVIASILPTLLGLIGLDFGITRTEGARVAGNLGEAIEVARGPILHTLLAWTAVMCAAGVVLAAAVHVHLFRDPVPAVIALAMIAGASTDGFHVLTADRLIASRSPAADIIPFTWAISRTFSISIMLLGAALVWQQARTPESAKRHSGSPSGSARLAATAALFALLAYSFITLTANASWLPQTTFPNAVVTRPWNVLPLGLFLLAGLVVFPRLHLLRPSAFTHALVLSTVADVAVQCHMAFGSTALFDHHFNAAHALKVLGYAIPLVGLTVEISALMKRSLEHATALEREVQTGAVLGVHLLGERHKAIAVSHSESEFLANISHEIRTPMNGVLGMTHLLVDTPLTSLQKEYLDVLEGSANDLLALLDNMLDISRIEADTVKIQRVPIDLRRLVHSCLRSQEARASKNNTRLVADIAAGVNLNRHGDPIRITQVLTNLVHNAIKFTDCGQVTISVRADGDRVVSFDVSDTGKGIAADQMKQEFLSSAQKNGITRNYGYAGLGLSISQRLVSLMGGELKVASEPGVGTVFSFELPLQPRSVPLAQQATARHAVRVPNAPRPHSSPPDSIHQLKVLVAEDHPVNQMLVRALIERTGHSVTMVDNGRRVVDLVAQAQFDLILMDLAMPVMDGLTATRLLRETGCAIPIIAVTAHAMPQDRERCLQSGMNGYLSKPIALPDLAKILQQATKSSGQYDPNDKALKSLPQGSN